MTTPPIPQVPNYIPGVGRLTTDRFDFQAHIDGANFRHNATQIDLLPLLTIGGSQVSTVQEAITALNNIVEPPSIAPATSTSLGTVQLSTIGDLQGSATVLRVVGLRGYGINNTPPSLNNVLTWNGSAWAPAPSQGTFTPGGDLNGTASIQNVIGLTGDLTSNPGFHTVRSSTDYIQFIQTANPKLVQLPQVSANGNNFNIAAQSTSLGQGGNLILQGGTGSTIAGSTMININGLGTVIQAGQVISNQNVVALFTPTGLTTSEMPFNSGDRVMYVGNANANPTTAPSGGAILYATSGQLWVMQADGNNFRIGSNSNPNTSGTLNSSSGEVVQYQNSDQAPTGSGVNVFSFAPFVLPNNTSIYINCLCTAKEVTGGTPSSASYHISMGFWVNNSGSVTSVGTNTTIDSRTQGAASWTAPIISSSASNLVITTGYSNSNPSNWNIQTTIVVSPQG